MFWPCETRTSTCRSFATISSGLYCFLAITVLLDVKDIPQVGPLQWGLITVTRARAGALIVLPDPVLYGQHPRIVTFATASNLPALFSEKEVVEAGGLIAYGPSIPASFRRAAAYVDKIL